MILSTASLLLACAPLGGVVVFEGSPGLSGDVAIADPGGAPTVRPAALQGIRLLPIELHGRTQLDELRPDRARLRQDVPLAARIELPQGAGSLYRFSRDEPGGGTTFGLMIVDASGDARSVLELAGTGSGGAETPFKQRVAVAPSGGAVLVATRPTAGGDLLEVDLATGAVENRTAALPPLKFGRAGLALAGAWGVAVADDRVLRFARAPGAQAESVALGSGGIFGTKGGWFSGELVLSPGGHFAATTIGSGPTSAHVWAFGPTGAAARVTDGERHLSPAGFLPEHDHGPYLAISDDGTRCAYRTEGLTREAFLAEVPPLAAPPAPAEHVSSDDNYLDTLDEIGQFMFQAVSTTLRLAVGESELGGPAIENLDLYTVSLPQPGALNITNQTLTNGIASPPFYAKSTIKPDVLSWVPSAAGHVYHDEESGGGGQVLASTGSGPLVLVADAKELMFLEHVGDRLVLGIRQESGNKDYELWTAPADLSAPASLVLPLPGSEGMSRPTARPDGWFAFMEETPSKERLWLYDTQSGATRFYRRLVYGPALDFAPSGELAFSVGAAGTTAIQAALPVAGPPVRLKVPVAPGFVLPGA